MKLLSSLKAFLFQKKAIILEKLGMRIPVSNFNAFRKKIYST